MFCDCCLEVGNCHLYQKTVLANNDVTLYISGMYASISPKKEQGVFNGSFNATVQPKLEIGAPNDRYEQEADAVADKVVSSPFQGSSSSLSVPVKEEGVQMMPATDEEEKVQMMPTDEEEKVQMMPAADEEEKVQMMPISANAIQLKCAECEEKEKVQRMEEDEDKVQMMADEEEKVQRQPELQKSSDGTMQASDNVAATLNNSKGKGQSLPSNTQQEMESKIGADFSGVRIHTDANAVQMSKEMGAKAFTHGSDVYFNKGNYQPDSKAGKHLLAHELTHTVQQGGAALKGKRGQRNGLTIQRKVGNSLIQRAVTETKQESHAGLFELDRHTPVGGPTFVPQGRYSVKVDFNPYQVVNCQEIDLTQTSIALVNGTPQFASAADRARALVAGEGTVGKAIDQQPDANPNPYYTRNTAGNQEAGTQVGKRTGNSKGTKAFLTDTPGLRNRTAGQRLAIDFETCAVCTKGVDTGTYYGCVSWGFDIDAANKFTEHPFNLVSRGTPSADFLAAAKKWNAQTVPVATNDLPIPTHGTHQADMTEPQLKARIKALDTTLKGLAAGHANIAQITFEIKVYKDILKAMAYNKGEGYHDRDIRAIQALVDVTPNGKFDFKTISKIKRWQIEQGLRGDGRFGPKSRKKYNAVVKAAVKLNKAKGHAVDQIKKIQRKVGSKDDGVWGPKTTKRLMAWQKTKGLKATGHFGLVTQLMMFGLAPF